MTTKQSLADRFFKKVIIQEGCWGWNASFDSHGYPQILSSHLRRPISGNRASWFIHFGKIPKGLCVLHKCDNPVCTNPKHLWLGTRNDNNRDRVLKGRSNPVHWPEHGASKLIGRIDEIKNRVLQGWSYRKISREMNVCHHTIKNVLSYQKRIKETPNAHVPTA